MSDETNTTPTPTTPPQGSDPIRPAHYRDPNTGRDRIAVWREVLDTYHFQAAIAATVDRYLSRAGRKPGVPAEVDHAKAAEVVRRYYEEWGEGAQEELRCLIRDFGHSHEAIDALLHAAEQPRSATPSAEVTPQHDVPPTERHAADVAIRAATAYTQVLDDDEATPGEVAAARRRWHEARIAYRDVTLQQAAGARPLPATPRQLVLGNGAVAMHVGTVGDDTHPRMLLLYSVEPGPIGHEDEVGMRPSALPAGASVMPDDPRLDVLIYCGRRESAEMLRDTVQEIIDEWPREEGDDPQAAQDDHAAALHPTRHQVSFALSALSDALGAAEEAGNQYVVDAVNAATEALEDVEAQQDAERERERADRAERALRLERGAPQPGDLPEGWRREPCTPRSYVNGTAKAVCLETGEWRWWCREGWGRSTTAAEAIDAANAAITAQRSDDTARDDSGSAAGEGEVTP